MRDVLFHLLFRVENEFRYFLEEVLFGDFDHPIEHSGSEVAVNFVLFEEFSFLEWNNLMFLDDVFAIEFVELFCD